MEKLKGIVSQYSAAIVYDPQNNEVDINTAAFPLIGFEKTIVIPPKKNSDPFAWASKCSAEFVGQNACIFIPGRKFDLSGTRHGRGGGWFDRFLSQVPAGWMRIGVARSPDISKKLLKRETWDEPVDWLLVQNELNWVAFETKARSR